MRHKHAQAKNKHSNRALNFFNDDDDDDDDDDNNDNNNHHNHSYRLAFFSKKVTVINNGPDVNAKYKDKNTNFYANTIQNI